MILEWKDKNYWGIEKLLGVIYDGTALSREDIQLILGWTYSTFRAYLYKANSLNGSNKGDEADESDKLIQKLRLSKYKSLDMYYLTENGLKYIQDMLDTDTKPKVMTGGQLNHTMGLNSILTRALRKAGPVFRWYSTREANDEFYLAQLISGKSEAEISKTLIRPDAVFELDKRYWIEFDNDTESGRTLFHKFQLYVDNLKNLPKEQREVVLVTTNNRRRGTLESLWRRVQNEGVQMHFFVEGDETAFLVDTINQSSIRGRI